MPCICPTSGGIILSVHAAPRAKRSAIAGMHGNALKIRLAAPPVDGKANEELVRFIAELLTCPTSAVRVLTGETSRQKRLAIYGISSEQARDILRQT